MMGLDKIVRKVFGTQNDRELKSITPLVQQINALEPSIKALSDAQLQAKTAEFKQRIAQGATLDDLLPEAFAVVREAAWRVIGQRHYDVQLIGGITLHRGRIAEMKTGEGKTLVSTLPAYLNALSGKGVHVITVNDYLARRDSEWMGQVHRFLGLETGIIVHGLNDRERKQNYACDVTYGTNNEFGFDYLRDNMKFRLEDYVQRELNFAIIDEVDSILVDEARTPLIISGPSDDATDLYYVIDRKIRESGGLVKETDYTVDEKSKSASLTEAGVDKMEKRLGVKNLFDPSNIELLHHVNQSLRSHVLYKIDVDYVVRDGEVLIVDEFTGRLMPGRRWSDGLHQAIEAKEGVTIESENQTLATITFQNYFRMYNKLSGMTGTADTEATEFKQIYKLDVTVIPTNRTNVRKDEADVIFKSERAKFKEIATEIRKRVEIGQPVLVGTVSIEKSEALANLLKAEGIKHQVLNAKQHEREAEVVAQAGRKAAVTISTNMAGRGTDILLGGNPDALAKAEVGALVSSTKGEPPSDEDEKAYSLKMEAALERWKKLCETEREEVVKAGGLFIIGTERHESRRIDNQLRGRAGRQGDPGGSRFYLSLEDDLMRIFGGVNMGRFMEDDVPIEHPWITKAIANAQRKVEAHNYDIRKHLLEYDDVMNQQRKVVYAWRREVLAQDELRHMVFSMVEELSGDLSAEFFPNGKPKRHAGKSVLDMKEINDAITVAYQIPTHFSENEIQPFTVDGFRNLLTKHAEAAYTAKEAELGDENVRQIEKMVLLTTIDQLWKEHLLAMDHMRDGIGLQGYGQKDPLVEYKKQGFRYFEMMMKQIAGDSIRKLFAVQVEPTPQDSPIGSPLELSARPASLALGLKPAKAPKIQYNLTADGELIPTQPSGTPIHAALDPQPVEELAGPGASRGTSSLLEPEDFELMARQSAPSTTPVRSDPKVGRNDVCPCGSGKKYKKCHGVGN